MHPSSKTASTLTLPVPRCWRWRRSTSAGCPSGRRCLRGRASGALSSGWWRWRSPSIPSYFPCECTGCPCSAAAIPRTRKSAPAPRTSRSCRSWSRPSARTARCRWPAWCWRATGRRRAWAECRRRPGSRRRSTGMAATSARGPWTYPAPLRSDGRTRRWSGCRPWAPDSCSRTWRCWPAGAPGAGSTWRSASRWAGRCAPCPASAEAGEPNPGWRRHTRRCTGTGSPRRDDGGAAARQSGFEG